MTFVIVWLLCGVVTAVIAGSKGRNSFGWLILGAILGIFGIILVAAMPSLKFSQGIEYEEPQRLFASTRRAKMKKCPDCAEQIRADANVCKHCGYRFAGEIGTARLEPRA